MGLPLVVAGFCAVLVAASPAGPVQQVAGAVGWLDDQLGAQMGDLVAGDGDLPGGLGLAGVLGDGGDGQEGSRAWPG